MNKKYKLTDKVTKESIRSPEFKRWLNVVLAAVCIFSLIFQLSTCAFQGLKVSASFPGDTVEIDILPSLPSTAIIDMDAIFESNGTTYYGIEINQGAIIYYTATDLPVSVYSGLSWANDSYRILTITQMSPFALTWITDNSTVIDSNYMTLKAGTYRFNDEMNFTAQVDQNLSARLESFSLVVTEEWSSMYGIPIGSYIINPIITSIRFGNINGDVINDNMYWDATCTCEPHNDTIVSIFTNHNWEPYFYGKWTSSSFGENSRIIIFDTDQTVSVQFGTLFIANTNYNEVNAPPPPEDVHDFTNEIRQFNDELTLYVTDSAEWSESFSFEFDVMGFGYSDTLYLKRGEANVYSMSYNFDIDGFFSPWQVYRYGFSTQSGGFLYQNARIIRFITNPDDIEFQQWLLDNTTLVATVDDAPAFDQFYETGYDVGYNAGYEQGFANSLIGDSLSGPINALSSITLIQIGDVEITLGGVVMTAIALCLVLAFLKLYAGG